MLKSDKIQNLRRIICEIEEIRSKPLGLFWIEFPKLIGILRDTINDIEGFEEVANEINEAEARHVCACYRIIAKTSGKLEELARGLNV